MRKKLLTILLALTLVLTLSGIGSAGEVSMDRAKTVAQNFLQYTVQAYGPWAGTDSPSISKNEVLTHEGQVVGYNFLVDPKGHILVSSRDDLPPVKLYSDTSTLSIYAEDIREQVEWIAEETFDIGQAIDEHSGELAAMDASQNPDVQAWALLGNSNFAQEYESLAEEAEFLSYGPLLSSTWGQGNPYNLQCPLDPLNSNCRTVVGCVATAAAQIMRHWGYPATGTGSTSYSWHGITLSRNFAASTYDCANMPNSLSSGSSTAQKNAVAKLGADVGVAFHMNYGCSASGCQTSDAPSVFKNYFRYKNTVTWVNRSSYSSQSAWMQVFKTETAAGRPSQLRISDNVAPYTGGHSVVVDGYRTSPSESVHINMGWSGSYDGWYTPDSFTTGNYNWTNVYRQGAAIRIEPPAVQGCSAAVTQLYSVNPNPAPGGTAKLWALVKNTGSSALPSTAQTWFWVDGVSGPNNYVGYASVGGLAAGSSKWFSYDWKVPTTYKPGSYRYYARVWDSAAGSWCGDWKGPQNFTVAAGCPAEITSLWTVGDKKPGDTATLWALVQNRSNVTINERVAFWVSGPSGPNNTVGYASVSGLPANSSRWVAYNWKVPAGHKSGDYAYWAKLNCGDWFGPQAFRIISTGVCSAQVTSLWPVGTINCGSKARLWADVVNTGSSTLPASARVWYWVSGPSGPNNYVGSAAVGGLAPGAKVWKLFEWTVPANYKSGTYSYWARVWDSATGQWCGDWKGPQNFAVICQQCTSFNEQFNGGTAPMWKRDKGSWSVVNNAFYYTPGSNNLSSTSTYNQDCRNFDFRAYVWRYGDTANAGMANRLFVRASGSVLSSGHYQNEYIFQYNRNGSFSVYKTVNGVSTALKSWTASSAINKYNAWNYLRVYANGNQFWFYINNYLVWSGTDSSLSSGREGVGMYKSSSTANNGFYVDYATLNALSGDADVPDETISDEQQQLNDIADKNPIGNIDSVE